MAFHHPFFGFLLAWIVLNSVLLLRRHESFDPYPFILLNLIMSMLASIQAPIIMMSQNRQSTKDRLDALNDYQVNLKAELEIMALHEKLDALREHQWLELISIQSDQTQKLDSLIERLASLAAPPPSGPFPNSERAG